MTPDVLALCGLAATIGFTHTILGPDHYLPFIAMSRAGGWSSRKTIIVTVLSGVAHVLSSVLLGALGITFGIAVFKLENIESVRGALAGWFLLGFGLAYMIWGLRRAIRAPLNSCNDSLMPPNSPFSAWVIFTIFLFGPCEPLIPLLMVPAAQSHWSLAALVSLVFGVTTILTMTSIVIASVRTVRFAPRLGGRWFESTARRYGHALAGFVVLVCGAAIKVGL